MLAGIESSLQENSRAINMLDPDFSDLISPKPERLDVVQKQLDVGQAVFMQFTDGERTFIVLITPDEFRYAETELTRTRMSALVESIRQGIDLVATPDPRDLPPSTKFSVQVLQIQRKS